MNNKYLLILLICISSFKTYSQQFVSVMDQTFIAHSTGNSFLNSNSNNRSFVKVDFPENTSGYIYRISISPKETDAHTEQLINLLKDVVPTNISMGVTLAQYVVQNSDGSAIDAFTFNNVYDADNFVLKRDGNWVPCMRNDNLVNTCYSSNKCINPTMFFGFRNNNNVQGLKVHLEIVAIVDANQKSTTKYSYSITNATDRELKYYISDNGWNWEEVIQKNDYFKNISSGLPYLYFKIVTTNNNYVSYKLNPNDRYKIIWSDKN